MPTVVTGRSESVRFRLAPEELEQLFKQADEHAGGCVADYIRDALGFERGLPARGTAKQGLEERRAQREASLRRTA